MYFDSFLKISCLDGLDILPTVQKLKVISEKFGVDFVLSISLDEVELPEELKADVIISL